MFIVVVAVAVAVHVVRFVVAVVLCYLFKTCCRRWATAV